MLSQNNLARLDTEPKSQTSTVSSEMSTSTNSGQNDFIDDMFQSELSQQTPTEIMNQRYLETLKAVIPVNSDIKDVEQRLIGQLTAQTAPECS